MLIICKSCKKLVDTDKHDFCPKCGSNFNYGENLTVANHTADYEEYERNLAEQQRAAVENRMSNTKQNTRKETQRRLKKQANQAQGKKNGCSGCLGIFVLAVFGFGVLGGIIEEGNIDIDNFLEEEFGTVEETADELTQEEIDAILDYAGIPDYIQDIEAEKTEEAAEEESIEEDYPSYYMVAGETAYTETYALTCTGVSLYENMLLPEKEGYDYISFTLRLENTTDSTRMYFGNVDCIAGEECTETNFSGIYFPGELEPGGVYENKVIFEIPEGEPFFDLYFNDEVVIYASVADIEGYYDYE